MFISENRAQELYQLDFLRLHALISTLPAEFRKVLTQKQVKWDSQYAKALDTKDLTKKAYRHLTINKENNNKRLNKVANKWENTLLREIKVDEIKNQFKNVNKVSNVNKYRSFQYRLLQNSLVTNKRMYTWGMLQTPNCSFCKLREENILHLLYNCEYVKPMWKELVKIMKNFTKKEIVLNYENIVFNKLHPDPKHVINLMCLVVKQYIYRQRCKKSQIKVQEIRNELYKIENIEKYIAVKNGHISKHNRKWAKI